MDRKGQTAHEFLTTYGWTAAVAILTLLVMFYFGIVNSDALRPEICQFPPESGIRCLRMDSTEAGTLTLFLENEGEARLLTSASCTYIGKHDEATTQRVTVDGQELKGVAWGTQEFITLTCAFDGDNPYAGRTGRKQETDVRLQLLDTQGTLFTLTGHVRAQVEVRQ